MIYFEFAFDKLGNPMKCCYCNCCHYHDRVSQYSTNRVDREFANPSTISTIVFSKYNLL